MLKRKKHRKKTSLKRTKHLVKLESYVPEKRTVKKPKPYKFPLDRIDILEDSNGEEVKKYTLKQLKELLPEKHRIAAHYYVRDWNLKQAMIKAGYSEAYATTSAYKVLDNTRFKQYVQYIQKDVAAEVGFSKIGLLTILWNQARANFGMVFDDWMTRRDFNEIRENNPEFIDALKEVQTRIEKGKDKDGNIVQTEWVKISLYDSQKAIELIFKAMGWTGPVAVKLDANINKTVNINKYTTEEKKVLLQIARNNDYYRESD